MKLYLIFLLSFYALSARSQGIFEEKYDACSSEKPCFYCGDTLPQQPDLFDEFLQRKISSVPHGYVVRDGKLLYEILVDSTGHPCVVSIDDHIFCWNIKNDIMVAINDMHRWTPAVLNHHRINSTIVFEFSVRSSKYTYRFAKKSEIIFPDKKN